MKRAKASKFRGLSALSAAVKHELDEAAFVAEDFGRVHKEKSQPLSPSRQPRREMLQKKCIFFHRNACNRIGKGDQLRCFSNRPPIRFQYLSS